MTTGTFTTTLELIVNGHSCEREVTIHYDFFKADGDGWNEPRHAAFAQVLDVEVTFYDGGNMHPTTLDMYSLLSPEVISALEADCILNEEAEREYRKCEAADLARSEVLS